jgi:hypothetical protein
MIGVGNTIGKFSASLGLDTKDYAKGIINAQTLNRVFGESFSAFVANPLLGSINILKNVGGAFVTAAQKQLEYAEVLQRTGQQLGVNEQLLVALQKRLEVAGFAGDIGSKGLQKFATSLLDLGRGAGPLKEVGDAIGLVLDPTAPLEANLRTLLDTIARLPSEAQRSAAAAKVFGEEAGPKLLNAIGGGSEALTKMIREAEQLGFRVDSLGNDGLAALNTQLGYTKLAVEGIKFNAMQSFFEGLLQGSSGSTEGILTMTDAINRELRPALQSLGQSSGPLLRDATAMLPGLVELLTLTVSAMRDLAEIWEGSWVQSARDALGAGVHRVYANDMYQLTPGQQRLMEMSPVQQQRRQMANTDHMMFLNGF